MLAGILIIAIVVLLGVLSHRRSRLENRIYRHIPLNDWLTILLLPVALYIGWFFVVKNILERPRIILIPLDDFDILAFTILFMVYGFVGNSLHFTGKILWRYLLPKKSSMAYKINEMFHGRLSHYLVFLNSMFIIFLLSVLEINHPVFAGVTSRYLALVALMGIIMGVSGTKAVFYTNEWFGGYHKPIFFIVSLLLIIILMMIKVFKLNFTFYPVNLFVASMGASFVATFVMRQLFIFSHLNNKRRLRFLAKILSA